jgi:hypothetical protein
MCRLQIYTNFHSLIGYLRTLIKDFLIINHILDKNLVVILTFLKFYLMILYRNQVFVFLDA